MPSNFKIPALVPPRLRACHALVLAACAALSGPAIAQAPPCNGTYEYFSGKNFVKAQPGNPLPKAKRIEQAYNNREGWVGQIIRKPQSEGLVEVRVGQCGAEFVLSQNGKRMLFLQSAADDTLYVAQDIGTDKAELKMRVVGHTVMVGQIHGASHGFEFTFPVAMQPRDTVPPDMEGCTPQDDQAAKPDFALENTAARAFMAAHGLTPPPQFSPNDYFRALETQQDTASDTRNRATRHVRFMLGKGNAILPTIGLREICRAGQDKFDPPRRMLNLKFYPVTNPDGYIVFAQVIDIETGKILFQSEAESTGRDALALRSGMTDAVNQLEANGAQIGPLSDGIAR